MLVMLYQAGPISGWNSVTAYYRRMTREGDPHRARQHRRVVCVECRAYLSAFSMAFHLQTHHGRSVRSRPLPHTLPPPLELSYYQVVFPCMDMVINCPVEDFPGR